MQTLCSFDTLNQVGKSTPNSIYMDNYHLKLSPKTRILNIFRSIFTLPLFEKALLAVALKSQSTLVQKLIPPDYLFKSGTYRTVVRNGIKYKLDISHVVDHFLYWGMNDTGYLSVLTDIKKAHNILDIGANIGTTSLYFASLNTKAGIYAFEPHPDIFKRAHENIQLNSFSNIQLINLGLGEKKESLKLYEVNEHNPGMNRIIAEDRNMAFKVIHVDTLDQMVKDKNISGIDFIKLDVEGFEYAVLKGGKETLVKEKPLLFIELDDNNLKENNSSAKELISLLENYGYKEFYRTDNNTHFTSTSDFTNCHYDMVAR